MSKRYLTAAVITIVGSLNMPPASAAPRLQAVEQDQFTFSRTNVHERLKAYYAWMNAPWTDDDQPYQRLRSNIDRAMASGQNFAAVSAPYQKGATQNPPDFEAQFAYYYAVYKAVTTPGDDSEAEKNFKLDNFYSSITITPHPHTYNYVRLAFFSELQYLPDSLLIGVGRRLLKHDPKDADVEYALAKALNYGPNATDRAQAMAYQQDLAHRRPNDPRTYRLLADIYYRTAWLNHNQADAERAVAAYQRSLEVAPASHEEQGGIAASIQFIRQLEARWRTGG